MEHVNASDPRPRTREDVLVIRSGIPPRYRQANLKDLDEHDENRTALKAGQDFMNNPEANKKGLMLVGPTGTGKTHLAAALALNELYRGSSVLFASTLEILREIRMTYREDVGSDTESQILSKFSRSDLLVLDDFGTERGTEWTREIFYDLINKRYNRCRTTIVTTNLSISQLEEQFDARIISRLVEMCRIINVGGQDFRIGKN